MAWRVSESLLTLRDQINALYPKRSKISDGTIGDPNHQKSNSDHNPWVREGKMGIVTALDVTHDPGAGLNSEALANALLDSRDSRIKYVISNSKIAAGSDGPKPWTWRKYTGKNPHSKHVHLSVKPKKAHYDDKARWKLKVADAPKPTKQEEEALGRPVLALGTKGADVEAMQKLLVKHGAALEVDADFGPKTEAAVIAFQRKHKIVADGRVGPYTWELLLA